MDESKARADRLRAMREAAGSNRNEHANGAPLSTSTTNTLSQSGLPAPFTDCGTATPHAQGFYTGAGSSTSGEDMILAVPAIRPTLERRAPPPPLPLPPQRWLEREAGSGGRRGQSGGRSGGRGGRGIKSPPPPPFNPADYVKVCVYSHHPLLSRPHFHKTLTD